VSHQNLPLKIVLLVVLALGLYLPKKTEDENDDEDENETFSSNVAPPGGIRNSLQNGLPNVGDGVPAAIRKVSSPKM
jgi:hypothetical protein